MHTVLFHTTLSKDFHTLIEVVLKNTAWIKTVLTSWFAAKATRLLYLHFTEFEFIHTQY